MPYSVNIWYGYFVNELADGHKIINARTTQRGWRKTRKMAGDFGKMAKFT